MTELEELTIKLITQGDRIKDLTALLTDCVARIAFGESPDPRADALATLRGCMMFQDGAK
jgi:hypothetical protein